MTDLWTAWGPIIPVALLFFVAIALNQSRVKKFYDRLQELEATRIAEFRKLSEMLERIATALEKSK